MILSETSGVPCATKRPSVGFLGVGWIGRHRLQALAEHGAVDVVGIADADPGSAAEIAGRFSDAAVAADLAGLLELKPQGIVIATPSALHAAQAIEALQCGTAVFCQKPLGRSAAETVRVVDTARAADRLLDLDMSYRHLRSAAAVKRAIACGEVGEIFAVDAVFHNAYGPDKAWYYDRRLAGGGCVMDLGIHLIDLTLWMLDFPRVQDVSSRLFRAGKPLCDKDAVEDYAVARLDLSTGATVNLACSWRLPAGCDAVIEASFYGTQGGLSIRNVAGSFYDFRAEHFAGTRRQLLDEPPDAWGGRAALAWVERLRRSSSYRADIEAAQTVAAVIDAIYD